ncbi:unnamed protein product [Euphydryas editha]|uniref:Reverse transcriptase n=1 Tax=Euphydryas editha TaxID=104508 RepID=A0AAU9U046_EUPED|nr:unnamed protein product [Euphydryas editha]
MMHHIFIFKKNFFFKSYQSINTKYMKSLKNISTNALLKKAFGIKRSNVSLHLYIPWFAKPNMRRSLVVTALRLKSGHIILNKLAYLRKKVDSPKCEVCGCVDVHVMNVLMECVRDKWKRQDLVSKLGLNPLEVGLFYQILSESTSQFAKSTRICI